MIKARFSKASITISKDCHYLTTKPQVQKQSSPLVSLHNGHDHGCSLASSSLDSELAFVMAIA